jgi:hypothetical protein
MTNQTFKRKLVWSAQAAFVALAMTLGLGAGTGVFAQTARTEKQDQKVEAKAQAAGQQAATDDKTGKSKQQAQDEPDALTEAMKQLYNRPTEGLKTTYLANGAVMVELTPEFMEVSVIKINPDGSKSVECVTGMKAAEESLKAQGAPAAQPTQKTGVPPVKGETGKTPQKSSEDKSKWEVK